MMGRFESPRSRREFIALERVLSHSAAARVERALQRAVASAFVQSRSHAIGRRLLESFRALPAPARLQLSGIALLVFVVVHVAWRYVMPASASPALPMALWVWLILLAAALTTAPAALVRAWRQYPELRRRQDAERRTREEGPLA